MHFIFQSVNLLLLSPTPEELKVIECGCARRCHPTRPLRVRFATPEFAAPEVLRDGDVTVTADMCIVGIISYIL